MSTESTTIKFTLSGSDYTDLWLRVKNKDSGSRTLELVDKLLQDHSCILQKIITYPKVKIVWSDDLGQDIKWDEVYGKEEQKK